MCRTLLLDNVSGIGARPICSTEYVELQSSNCKGRIVLLRFLNEMTLSDAEVRGNIYKSVAGVSHATSHALSHLLL